jgi:hypothetical protein
VNEPVAKIQIVLLGSIGSSTMLLIKKHQEVCPGAAATLSNHNIFISHLSKIYAEQQFRCMIPKRVRVRPRNEID